MRHLSLVAAFAVASWSCGTDSSKTKSANPGGAADSGAKAAAGADLTGAGATFPAIVYAKWIDTYATKTGVKINYQPIGSGGGIKQLQEQTVDFGASDAPMTDAEMAGAKGGPVMHIPMVGGVVAIAYNLSGVTQPIKLTPGLLADIFAGKLTKWSDSRIAAANPGLKLPATDILVVHRSEGSGTTYIFSDYLSSVSPAWKASPGKGKELQWPVGLGAKGNDGVAAQVKSTPGAVGYVELAYAKQNNLSTALLQNADGKFVAPTAEAATNAVQEAAAKLPANTDYRISIVNSPGATSYPISSLTWLLIYKKQPDAAKAKKLTDFIRWALQEGGPQASALDYAPLPKPVVDKLVARLDSLSGTGSTP
ncbi:MAG TPA: phosphate ABC transporter substrate-binding protein PstS [Gemmatimonadaceae bacterium]|nr:phosphate ABC transporter substrate-binding protein PstS [Gemmatimonadaceae bacterium]